MSHLIGLCEFFIVQNKKRVDLWSRELSSIYLKSRKRRFLVNQAKILAWLFKKTYVFRDLRYSEMQFSSILRKGPIKSCSIWQPDSGYISCATKKNTFLWILKFCFQTTPKYQGCDGLLSDNNKALNLNGKQFKLIRLSRKILKLFAKINRRKPWKYIRTLLITDALLIQLIR
jgi:hypothetical protein